MGNNSRDNTPPDQRAIDQLGACSSTIQEFERTIRAMVDDVIITSENADGIDLLMAWELGRTRVEEIHEFLLSLQEESIDFTESTSFDEIDGAKKSEYIDTLRAVQRDIKKLSEQYHFFVTIYHITQREQIIALLWENLILNRNRLLAGQLDESLGKRASTKLQKNIQATRVRLKHEIHGILQQLESISRKKHFGEMQAAKQNEFYEMWKIHTASLSDIDRD